MKTEIVKAKGRKEPIMAALVSIVNNIGRIRGRIKELQELEEVERTSLISRIKDAGLKPDMTIEGEDFMAYWQLRTKTSVDIVGLRKLVGQDKLMELVTPNIGEIKKALKAEEFEQVANVRTNSEPTLTIREKKEKEA